MMKLHLIVFGTLKESYWKEAANEYGKRLGLYTKIRITEIREESFQSALEREEVQKKEAEKIRKYTPHGTRLWVFDETGKEFTSPEFAKLLENATAQGDEITCVIGGPLGLHPSIKQDAERIISFGKMTLPHQLARVTLLEQIYRAGTILAEKQYHY